jgi:hypothetical protein
MDDAYEVYLMAGEPDELRVVFASVPAEASKA